MSCLLMVILRRNLGRQSVTYWMSERILFHFVKTLSWQTYSHDFYLVDLVSRLRETAFVTFHIP